LLVYTYKTYEKARVDLEDISIPISFPCTSDYREEGFGWPFSFTVAVGSSSCPTMHFSLVAFILDFIIFVAVVQGLYYFFGKLKRKRQ